jgi:hypothetical protein
LLDGQGALVATHALALLAAVPLFLELNQASHIGFFDG